MARKEHPRYENTEWDEYEFREWPMMIYPGSADGGKTPDRDPRKPGKFLQDPVTVHSEEERRQVLELSAPEPEPERKAAPTLVDAGDGTKRLKTEADERAELIQRAEVLGVQIDKRWTLARIEDAIQAHEAASEVV